MPLTLKDIVSRSPRRAIDPPRYLLGMDPGGGDHGGTTGWCLVDAYECTLLESGQFRSSFYELDELIEKAKAYSRFVSGNAIAAVVESYLLYPWKAEEQTMSNMYTPRFIGATEYCLYKAGIPVIFQSANQGKTFCTNVRLQEWNFWKKAINGISQKHANDACRHPAAYLIFGHDQKPQLLQGNYEKKKKVK